MKNLPLSCPATLELGASVVERLRQKLAATTINVGIPGGITVTASFGIADNVGGADMASLLARADKALYRAKESGRNKVEVEETPQGV